MNKYNSVHIVTLGCKVNQYESASFHTSFEENGFTVSKSNTDVDVVIINTCAVTAKAGSQSRNAIRRAARENQTAKLIITGCYSQLEAEQCLAMEELNGRDVLFIGNDNKDKVLPASLSQISPAPLEFIGNIRETKTIAPLPVKRFGTRTRAYLRVQDGCDSFCTYCIVPYTRGPSRSLPLEDVLKQAHVFKEQGHKEIVITGIHAGNYGNDLDEGENIFSLIEKLCVETPDVHYRLSSIEPFEVTEKLLHLMAGTKNFLNHLHIPLQSGDTFILEKMERRYNTEQFSEIIDLCHKIVPNVAIGIDVLAGFPGEDSTSFEKTKSFLEKLDFTYLHVFPYSIRPGTPAADFPDQVPKNIKDDRVAILRKISDEKRQLFNKSHIGTTRPVLIEGSRDKNGKLKGFTDNYIPVLMEGNDQVTHSIQLVLLSKQIGTEIHGDIVTNNER